jgi:hypothetical protein
MACGSNNATKASTKVGTGNQVTETTEYKVAIYTLKVVVSASRPDIHLVVVIPNLLS